MSFFLRMVCGLFLLLATVALVADLTRYANGLGLHMTSLYDHWSGLAPVSLRSFKQFVQNSLHARLWEFGVARLLTLPSWLVFGAVSAIFGVLGRRKRGVNIYAN